MTTELNAEDVQRVLGLTFSDQSLLLAACNRGTNQFRILEFYGDSILNVGTLLWALHSTHSETAARQMSSNRHLASRVRELFPPTSGQEIGDFIETLTAAVALDQDFTTAIDVATGLVGIGNVSHLIDMPQPPEDPLRFPSGGSVSLGQELVRYVVTDQIVRTDTTSRFGATRLNRHRSALLSKRKMNGATENLFPTVRSARRRRRLFYREVTAALRNGGLNEVNSLVVGVVLTSEK